MRKIISSLSPRGIALAMILLAILTLQVTALLTGPSPEKAVAAPVVSDQSKSMVRALEGAFTSVVDQIEPTIVFIRSERDVKAPADPFEDFWRRFGFPSQPRQNRKQLASGSGVIVRADGYILTNDHVVGGADRVTITLNDKREFKGTVLRDPTTDLALVKINATNLPAAPLGDSDKVKAGQWALAFGNPGGQQFSNTLTVGIVSAITREFQVPDPDNPDGRRTYPDAIQTDAAINPGNSGGPLVNIDGQIIGINAAIWSPTGSSVGIGFAIPSNTAKYVMDQLIKTGKVAHGRLGLSPTDLTGALQTEYGAKSGALVQSVEPGSPADKAGIKVEDVITMFNGHKIDSAAALVSAVRRTAPGTKANMTIIRDKKPISLQVTVGEMTDDQPADKAVSSNKVGLSVSELTPAKAKELKIDPAIKGVLVDSVESGSAADEVGIQPNDVILKINGKKTPTVAAYNNAVSDIKSGDDVVVIIQRGKFSRILQMTLE